MKWLLALAFLPQVLLASSQMTVSGISSGAYMAQQFHTAFSSEVSGVGIVAGGPYYCAQGQALFALNRCMGTGMGSPIPAQSILVSQMLASMGLIDPIHNIANSKVYVLSGKRDETVVPKVVDAVVETYRQWGVAAKNIRYVNDLNVGHAFPTERFGNSCETPSKSPFISKCGKDVAGEILEHLNGPLNNKAQPRVERFFVFNQLSGLNPTEVALANMSQKIFAYVPYGCEHPDANGCSIHIAFHGCQQTIDNIGGAFITETGYNAWAEANRIVVVYPQAVAHPITNPNGCWDWWGYAGPYYHTKMGIQLKQVHRLVKQLKAGKLELKALTP